MKFLLCFLLFSVCFGSVNIVPLPQSFHEKSSEDDVYFILGYKTFPITPKKEIPELSDAIKRYKKIFFEEKGDEIVEMKTCTQKIQCIDSIVVNVNDPTNVNPSLDMKEDYSIVVEGTTLHLECSEVFGCYHGLETLSQSIVVRSNEKLEMLFAFENYFPMKDFPRFKHRGMMIDSSRHFLPVGKILKILDGFQWSKINVLHWHIVDTQSFPLFISEYPKLSKEGAYFPTAVYSHADLKSIVEYARKRGIRVILEVDVPGHSTSWKGYDVLANCPNHSPILSPIKDLTYEVLEGVIKEMADIFPEPYFHFGGDEVSLDCWKQDEDIRKWMEDHKQTDYKVLVSNFDKKLHDIYRKYNLTMICWEECLLDEYKGYSIPKDTIVQVWKTGSHWDHLHTTIVEKKYNALLSGGWYLNYYREEDWNSFYLNEPFDKYNYTDEEKARLLGVSACLWAEHVDPINWDTQAYPGLLGYSERAWSNEKIRDTNDARRRVDGFRCELVRRGVKAQPLQPGFCYWSNIKY